MEETNKFGPTFQSNHQPCEKIIPKKSMNEQKQTNKVINLLKNNRVETLNVKMKRSMKFEVPQNQLLSNSLKSNVENIKNMTKLQGLEYNILSDESALDNFFDKYSEQVERL